MLVSFLEKEKAEEPSSEGSYSEKTTYHPRVVT